METFENIGVLPLEQRIARCRLLDGSEIPFVQNEQGIEIRVPKENWEPLDTVVRLEIQE
ncbi:hypothetical protein [Paenibacillus sp. MDMC362]|uniref:hypothetical protein n=1 Tax=Paenibacillus sp. MDMC362 TaxID=2977365 RepID=UPI0015EC5BC8|nr:hypothetical protein [Paenibacillus sp. MDMC362]